MDKLYLVRHTDIALKSIQRGFTDDSGVFENHTNLKVFKKREKAEKYIIEWYNQWPEFHNSLDDIMSRSETANIWKYPENTVSWPKVKEV